MIEWNYCPECSKKLDTVDGLPTCPDGHFTKYPNPVAGNLALIRHENKYLFLKRAREPYKGEYALPGGFCENGENSEQAVIREIKEETGFELNDLEYFGSFPSRYGDDGEHTLVMGYIGEVEDGNVQLSSENDDYLWREIHDAPELAFPDCKAAVEKLKKLSA